MTTITRQINQRYNIRRAKDVYCEIDDEDYLIHFMCEMARYFLIRPSLNTVEHLLEEVVDRKFTRMVHHLMANGSTFYSIDYDFMAILLEEYFIDLANRAAQRTAMDEEQTDAFVLAVSTIVIDQETES